MGGGVDELLTDGQVPRGAQRQGLGRHGGHWGVPVGLTVGQSFKLLRSGWQARQELWQMGEPMFFSGEGPCSVPVFSALQECGSQIRQFLKRC